MSVDAIIEFIKNDDTGDSISDSFQYMSSQSVEMFKKTPLYIKYIDESESTFTNDPPKNIKIKIFTGAQYASVKMKLKNAETGRWETVETILIKEYGIWKLDMIQTTKLYIN